MMDGIEKNPFRLQINAMRTLKLLAEQGNQDAIEKLKHHREYNIDYCRSYREKQREKAEGEVSWLYAL